MNASALAHWHIEKAGGSRKGDSVEHIQSHSELEELEMLIREVVQNCLDAMLDDAGGPKGGTRVAVRIRMRQVAGQEKRDFLKVLDGEGTYVSELRETRDYLLFTAEQHKGSKPHTIQITEEAINSFSPDHPETLTLLYVEDEGTTGLTGEEFDILETSRFCAFARDQQFTVKGGRSSGGSHGRGKNTLWRNARCRLILAYSKLSEPYRGQTDRFIGVGRLPWHADHVEMSDRRNGHCYLGSDDSGLDGPGSSVLGPNARELGRLLGMPRDGYATGTSLCVVGFDPRGEFIGRDADDLLADIAHAAATWYWPAIVDGKLTISIVDDASGKRRRVDPYTDRPDLEPYIDAWEISEERDGANSRVETVGVPKGPGPDDRAIDASYVIGCRRCETEVASTDPPRRSAPADSVALIRGFGMVVQYRSVRPRALGASNYAGVCRAGMAVPGAGKAGERLEVLLSAAEPPAHDVWRPGEIDKAWWPGARARVTKVLSSIQSAVDQLAGGGEKAPPGETLPELARRFQLSRGVGPAPRTNKLAFHSADDPFRAGDMVRFKVEVLALGGTPGDQGHLIVMMRGELQDPAAGPLAGARGEVIEPVAVRLGGTALVPERVGRTEKWRVAVDLGSGMRLPTSMEVTLAVSGAMAFEDASVGLKLWGRVEGL